MTRYGFQPLHINWLYSDLKSGGSDGSRLPSKADLGKWLKKELITVKEYAVNMELLDYLPKYIVLYLKDLGYETDIGDIATSKPPTPKEDRPSATTSGQIWPTSESR